MTTNSGPSVTQTVNTQANMEPAGPNSADLTIAQYSAVQLWYDPDDSQWHALAWS